jgi:hypothetical protein
MAQNNDLPFKLVKFLLSILYIISLITCVIGIIAAIFIIIDDKYGGIPSYDRKKFGKL